MTVTLPPVGTLLRSLDPRDENRIVRVIEVCADRVRIERLEKNANTGTVKFGRRTHLSRESLGRWAVVTPPEYMSRMELIREVERLREALEEIATRPTVERNPDGDDQAASTMRLIARNALRFAPDEGER